MWPTITKVYGPVLCSITRSGLYGQLLQRCMVQCYVALQGVGCMASYYKGVWSSVM